jgi:hypothetical protein
VDKPVLSAYFACKSKEEAKRVLKQVNNAIAVTNSDGKSLLKEKYDPNNL